MKMNIIKDLIYSAIEDYEYQRDFLIDFFKSEENYYGYKPNTLAHQKLKVTLSFLEFKISFYNSIIGR